MIKYPKLEQMRHRARYEMNCAGRLDEYYAFGRDWRPSWYSDFRSEERRLLDWLKNNLSKSDYKRSIAKYDAMDKKSDEEHKALKAKLEKAGKTYKYDTEAKDKKHAPLEKKNWQKQLDYLNAQAKKFGYKSRNESSEGTEFPFQLDEKDVDDPEGDIRRMLAWLKKNASESEYKSIKAKCEEIRTREKNKMNELVKVYYYLEDEQEKHGKKNESSEGTEFPSQLDEADEKEKLRGWVLRKREEYEDAVANNERSYKPKIKKVEADIDKVKYDSEGFNRSLTAKDHATIDKLKASRKKLRDELAKKIDDAYQKKEKAEDEYKKKLEALKKNESLQLDEVAYPEAYWDDNDRLQKEFRQKEKALAGKMELVKEGSSEYPSDKSWKEYMNRVKSLMKQIYSKHVRIAKKHGLGKTPWFNFGGGQSMVPPDWETQKGGKLVFESLCESMKPRRPNLIEIELTESYMADLGLSKPDEGVMDWAKEKVNYKAIEIFRVRLPKNMRKGYAAAVKPGEEYRFSVDVPALDIKTQKQSDLPKGSPFVFQQFVEDRTTGDHFMKVKTITGKLRDKECLIPVAYLDDAESFEGISIKDM